MIFDYILRQRNRSAAARCLRASNTRSELCEKFIIKCEIRGYLSINSLCSILKYFGRAGIKSSSDPAHRSEAQIYWRVKDQ